MHLDLDKLLAEGSGIYVLNQTNPKGVLNVTFNDAAGRNQIALKIPKTWIPTKVSGPIPPALIKESIDFRRFLHNGMLALISEEQALKILHSKEGIEEQDILNRSKFADPNAGGLAQKLRDDKAAQLEQTLLKKELHVDESEEQAIMKINPSIIDISHRYNQKDLDGKSAMREIRCIQEQLKEEDCNYLIANCDGLIREFARERLEFLVTSQPV